LALGPVLDPLVKYKSLIYIFRNRSVQLKTPQIISFTPIPSLKTSIQALSPF